MFKVVVSNKRRIQTLTMIVASVFMVACNMPVSRVSTTPLQTVAAVDLNKYTGRWYEIYRLPNWFEDAACRTVTADYSLREDGNIKVINTCYTATKKDVANGVAKIVDTKTNSKLKVSFFGPFYGDYWILDLASDYSWVIVGENSGKYLWILARKPMLDQATDAMLIQKVRNLGYMTDRLLKPANDLPAQ